MPRSSEETRRLAYRLWQESNGNLSETVRQLAKEHGLGFSRQTISNWRNKYDWILSNPESGETKGEQTVEDDMLLSSLMSQKEKYDNYFAGLPDGEVDNKAISAYNGILKTIVDIKQKQAARVRFGENESMPVSDSAASRKITSTPEAIQALFEAVEKKINHLLNQPAAVNLSIIKDMEKAIDLIEKMKVRYAAEAAEDKPSGLTAEAAAEIRKQILGISEK